jgi:hypothetical protein
MSWLAWSQKICNAKGALRNYIHTLWNATACVVQSFDQLNTFLHTFEFWKIDSRVLTENLLIFIILLYFLFNRSLLLLFVRLFLSLFSHYYLCYYLWGKERRCQSYCFKYFCFINKLVVNVTAVTSSLLTTYLEVHTYTVV